MKSPDSASSVTCGARADGRHERTRPPVSGVLREPPVARRLPVSARNAPRLTGRGGVSAGRRIRGRHHDFARRAGDSRARAGAGTAEGVPRHALADGGSRDRGAVRRHRLRRDHAARSVRRRPAAGGVRFRTGRCGARRRTAHRAGHLRPARRGAASGGDIPRRRRLEYRESPALPRRMGEPARVGPDRRQGSGLVRAASRPARIRDRRGRGIRLGARQRRAAAAALCDGGRPRSDGIGA